MQKHEIRKLIDPPGQDNPLNLKLRILLHLNLEGQVNDSGEDVEADKEERAEGNLPYELYGLFGSYECGAIGDSEAIDVELDGEGGGVCEGEEFVGVLEVAR